MPDRPILACRIHCLEDQQHGVSSGCIVELLQGAQLLNVVRQDLIVLRLGFVDGIDDRQPLLEVDVVPFTDAEVSEMYFHLLLLGRWLTRRRAGLALAPQASWARVQ
jgi:hypothetical protein